MKTWAEILIEEVESLVGRSLSESEAKTMTWLAGWETETRANVTKLVKAAYMNGITRSHFSTKEPVGFNRTEV